MLNFIDLPCSIVFSVLSDWIDAVDLCNYSLGGNLKKDRPFILELFQKTPTAVLDLQMHSETDAKYKWLSKYNFRVKQIQLGLDMFEKIHDFGPLIKVESMEFHNISAEGRVNMEWYIAAISISDSLKSLALNQLTQFDDVIEFKSFHCLEELEFNNCCFPMVESESNGLVHFVNKCLVLKTVRFKRVMVNNDWIPMLSKFPSKIGIEFVECCIKNLHNVCISCGKAITAFAMDWDHYSEEYEELLTILYETAPNLTSLKLSNAVEFSHLTLQQRLPYFTNLTELAIPHCNINLTTMKSLCCNYGRKLRSLSLYNDCIMIETEEIHNNNDAVHVDTAYKLIAKFCKNLETLVLYAHHIEAANDGLQLMLQECNKLRTLNLSYVKLPNLTDMELVNILKTSSRQLTNLDLMGHEIRDYALAMMLHCLPKLTELSLSSAKITIEAFRGTEVKVMCRLKLLHLSPTASLAEQEVWEIREKIFPRCIVYSKYGSRRRNDAEDTDVARVAAGEEQQKPVLTRFVEWIMEHLTGRW